MGYPYCSDHVPLLQLRTLFPDVTIAKPKSSRNSSIEAFVVCRSFTPPPNFSPEALQGLLASTAIAEVVSRKIIVVWELPITQTLLEAFV